MKNKALFFVLLPFLAVAAFAQESRQDVSLSASGLFMPYVVGNTVKVNATIGFGALVSYRYMLTPRSALEGNYQYAQDNFKYLTPINNIRVHSRVQEVSGAYVYNFSFRNFNPFAEVGIGAYLFSPIADTKTTNIDAKKTTNIGVLYGAGIAYELSPSFDIRMQYRGIVLKSPTFGDSRLNTTRYFNLNDPTIGIAYHF